MNRTLKATAVLMLMMVFAVGCTKPSNTDRIVPQGAINGLFSVSESAQVYFSQGNLQYQASTGIWRFAEHQWDYVGGTEPEYGIYGNVYELGVRCDNTLISQNYDGWIDLFPWATSGHGRKVKDSLAIFFHPYDLNRTDLGNTYNTYGYEKNNLFLLVLL